MNHTKRNKKFYYFKFNAGSQVIINGDESYHRQLFEGKYANLTKSIQLTE